MRPIKRWLASLLMTLLLTSGVPAFGQSSETYSPDEEKSIEAALTELAGRRREVEALKSALGARDERVRSLERIVADQDKLIEQWRTAALARKDANETDDEIKASYEKSVQAYATELARVREERDSARKWRDRFGIALIVVVTAGAVFAATDN